LSTAPPAVSSIETVLKINLSSNLLHLVNKTVPDKEEEQEQESNLLPDVNLMLSQQESVVNSTSSFQH